MATHMYSRLTLAAVILCVPVVASACSSTQHAAVAPGGQPATQSVGARLDETSQRRVEVNGLTVTLTIPHPPTSPAGKAKLAAGEGQFTLSLRAQNTSDATITARYYRNRPHLLDRNGNPVGAELGIMGGPGLLNRPPGPMAVAPAYRRPISGPQAIAPGGYVDAVVITKYATTGRGYSVRWDFGNGRVAIIELP